MSSPEPEVYLDDLDPSLAKMAAKRKAQEISSSAEPSKPKKVARIGDFFSTGPSSSRRASGTTVKAGGLPKLNSIPFSLSAFQASLSEEELSLLRLECETLGLSWMKMLKDEIRKPYFLDLKRYLRDAGLRSANDTPSHIDIYPVAKDIYSWSKTPLGKVKVVIIGQDPYFGAGQAHGLCFSVPVGVKIPPSLVNIYQELKSEYPDFQAPKHGNLVSWANNGVLMLNTCLTVKAGAPGSHSNRGWETFTQKVINVVDQYGGANLPSGSNGSQPTGVGRGVVFIAWGKWAAERVSNLSKSKHLILTSAHPSPRSADRGFFGNGHFVKANEWLENKYGPEGKVDWCSL